MENITENSLLYQIEQKIASIREEKIALLASDKNHPNLPNVNERLGSLVLIKSELIRENKNNNEYRLTKDEETILLNQMAEKRKQNVKDYSNNGRPELADAETKELLVIQEFLPKMPTEEEIKEFISKTIDEYIASQAERYVLSMKDMGKIKPLINATYPTVNGGIIKDVLTNKLYDEHITS